MNKFVFHNFVFIVKIKEIRTQHCFQNVAQLNNSAKLIVHKSLLTHGK